MSQKVIYVENDNNIILGGLKNDISGEFITGAAVTCDILDASGDTILSGALTLSYTSPDDIDDDLLAEIGADGNYIATLEEDEDIQPGSRYTAVIDVDAGSDLIAHFEVPLVARKRRS